MAVLAGDYGGYNAIANRQAAAARRGVAQPAPPPAPKPQRAKQAPPRASTTSGGQYTRPKAVPVTGPGPVPDLNAFLGSDTAYQQQLRQFGQAFSDLNADVTRRKGSLESEYGLSTKALADQRGLDLKGIEEDYGARGLLRSGLYGKAVGDYETEYGQRTSDLARRENDALAQLQQELTQFGSQRELQEQAAREAAARRRAEQYGV